MASKLETAGTGKRLPVLFHPHRVTCAKRARISLRAATPKAARARGHPRCANDP